LTRVVEAEKESLYSFFHNMKRGEETDNDVPFLGKIKKVTGKDFDTKGTKEGNDELFFGKKTRDFDDGCPSAMKGLEATGCVVEKVGEKGYVLLKSVGDDGLHLWFDFPPTGKGELDGY